MNSFNALLPLLILVAGALVALMLEVFLKRENKNHFSFKQFKVNDQYTGSIYGFFRDLLILKNEFNIDKFVISVEGGKKQK